LENPLDWACFCARLPDAGAEEIYSGGADILIAAQFGRPLNATSTDGGYRISGRAPFVSNCYDANWMSSTVLVDVEHAEGEPEMRMVYFPREQCEIIDTWDVMGMRGTGSNDISVTDVYVPDPGRFRWCRTSSRDRTIGARYIDSRSRAWRRLVSRRRCWGWRDELSTR
jgi:Acyl-CoA dehydrogenases